MANLLGDREARTSLRRKRRRKLLTQRRHSRRVSYTVLDYMDIVTMGGGIVMLNNLPFISLLLTLPCGGTGTNAQD